MPALVGLPLRWLRSTSPPTIAVPAKRSVVLAVGPPVIVELFSQHQQRCSFGQCSIFTAQFTLQFQDAFFVFARLFMVSHFLRLHCLLTADAGLTPGVELLGIQAVSTA